jgi:hypothetical protein
MERHKKAAKKYYAAVMDLTAYRDMDSFVVFVGRALPSAAALSRRQYNVMPDNRNHYKASNLKRKRGAVS